LSVSISIPSFRAKKRRLRIDNAADLSAAMQNLQFAQSAFEPRTQPSLRASPSHRHQTGLLGLERPFLQSESGTWIPERRRGHSVSDHWEQDGSQRHHVRGDSEE